MGTAARTLVVAAILASCGSPPATGGPSATAAPPPATEQVYLATDTAKLMQEAGLTPPEARSKSFKVMGKEFDPAKPEDYLNSFAIKRA